MNGPFHITHIHPLLFKNRRCRANCWNVPGPQPERGGGAGCEGTAEKYGYSDSGNLPHRLHTYIC